MLHTLATIWLWIMVFWIALGALLQGYNVGKPRKPTTGGVATTTVIIGLLTVTSLIVVLTGA